jgi:hypothetical protein
VSTKAYHDQDTPSNSPLLRSDNTTTLRRRRKLRNIHRDLRRADTNSHAIDQSPDNKHTNVLRSARDDGTDHPDRASNLNSATTTKLVGEVARYQCAQERTAWHRCGDATLDVGSRSRACLIRGSEWRSSRSLVEVASVLLGWQTVGCQESLTAMTSNLLTWRSSTRCRSRTDHRQ